MSTVKTLQIALGQIVGVHSESWIIPMEVLDVKQGWGKVRFLVQPLSGCGQQWVEIERLSRWTDDTISQATIYTDVHQSFGNYIKG